MTNTDAVINFLDVAQEQLALCARRHYETDGRGALLVAVPQTPLEFVGTAVIKTDMTYHTLDEIRACVTDLRGDARADADVLIQMIETYDPEHQGVVSVTIGAGNPVTVKLRLVRPNVVDEADGVH